MKLFQREGTKEALLLSMIAYLLWVFVSQPLHQERISLETQTKKRMADITQWESQENRFSPAWQSDFRSRQTRISDLYLENLERKELEDFFLGAFSLSELSYQGMNVSRETKVSDLISGNQFKKLLFKAHGQLTPREIPATIQNFERYPGFFQIEKIRVEKSKNPSEPFSCVFQFSVGAWEAQEPNPNDQRTLLTQWGRPKVWKKVEKKREEIVQSNSPSLTPPELKLKISQLIGKGIVVDETLFTEGEKFNGWTLESVDPKNRWVKFRWGLNTKKVYVP